MSDTTPSGASEPAKEARPDGGEETATPSTQENTEVENGEQEEATPDDLNAEAQELLKEEKPDAATEPKPTDDKAKADFQQKDDEIRDVARIMRNEGKTNIEIIRELKEEGVYPESHINRLRKLMANGSLEESAPEETPTNSREQWEKWNREEKQKSERDQAIEWYKKDFVKELGLNIKNSVAIEKRKSLLAKAKEIYFKTSPEHRNFKESLELAAGALGLNNKEATQAAIKKAVKSARTSVPGDTGTPPKNNATKPTYTEDEYNKKLDSLEKAGKRDERLELLRKVNDGEIKLED